MTQAPRDLDPGSRALMDAAAGLDEPSAADEERVWNGLGAKLAAGAAVGVGLGAASAKAAGSSAVIAKATVAIVAVAMATTGTIAFVRHRSAVTTAPIPAVAPPPEVTVAKEPPAVVTITALEEETRLLRDAQVALRDKRPAEALRILSEHEQRFPSGILTPERRAARVFALCETGERTQARREAKDFLQAFPQSPLASEVRRTCTR